MTRETMHIVLTVGFFLAFMICWWIALRRGIDLALERKRADTAASCYSELMKGSVEREQALRAELSVARKFRDFAESDADRLFPIVVGYLSDIDKTAALMQDPEPPKMVVEREAVRLHEEAVKARGAA